MPNSFAHLYLVEPSPQARRLLWHLLSVGSVTLDEPDRHEALEKPGAHLFWVQSGKGTLEVPGRSYSLRSGPRAWLVDMKKPRTYAPVPGARIVNAGFRFGGPELESWREQLGDDNEFALEKKDFELIRKATQRLMQLVRRRPAGYEWEVHVQITEVLGRLLNARHVFSASQLEVPAALRRAVSLVMADPSRDWHVPELAKAAGASRSSLQRLFKIYQQESIHEFLQRTRLDRARQLLCDDRLAVKEISARLNFSSEFYFSRFFRKKTGLSPRAFRQSIKV
jgi:AraC-like DNA-binding protein